MVFLYSNWRVFFNLKWPKLCHFGPEMGAFLTRRTPHGALFSSNMVSILAVEALGVLPYPYWPDFYQKLSKLGHFKTQMAQIRVY